MDNYGEVVLNSDLPRLQKFATLRMFGILEDKTEELPFG